MRQDRKLRDTLPDEKKSSVLTKCMVSNSIRYLIIATGIGVMLIVGVILLVKYIGLKNQLKICHSKS